MVRKTLTVADSGSRKLLRRMDVYENVQTDSDSAWDFEPIFVYSQTLDFRVERARWQA